MNTILYWIKRCIPTPLLNGVRPVYHFAFAYIGARLYGRPSKKLTVIAVTGTKGKSTVTEIITRILEADDSPVAGNVGYAFAPTNLTNASSSLSAWGFTTIRHAPTQTDIEEFVQWDAAREFILWATSPEFAQLAAENLPDGWADAPQGTRQSTYENPAYLDANQPYAETVLGAITTAPLHNPGTTPRPGIGGVQYVGVPEFQHVSAECSEQISLAISREQDVDTALDACQKVATEFTS